MNPIIQAMNRSNNPVNPMQEALRDPQRAFNNMMQSNPQFQKFMAENKGLSPQQIASKYGINPALLASMQNKSRPGL